ncbi:hypothetical protein OTK49_28450 [Vibrio coralliirubri]|uniref:hypothetical protein n=1 Tax=Vibrio coralliirubri TaxID=1516159 RepID=UPI0022836C4F|nr:hypothetical protein [Vibrio coralliirubri]MCY9866475.1 hypothetical protein [Vibrio coralliirubri]
MKFNKINFLSHLVDSYVKLGKQNGFTNNLDHTQVTHKCNDAKIDFGRWILLQHLVTIGTEGMRSEHHTSHSKGGILAYLATEIERRKKQLNSDDEAYMDAYQLPTEDAIRIGAIKALEELKSYILTQK